MLKYFQKLMRLGARFRNPPDDLKSFQANSDEPFSSVLDKNLNSLKGILGAGSDLVFREFVIGPEARRAALVFVDGLVNQSQLIEGVMKPLIVYAPIASDERSAFDDIDNLSKNIIASSDTKKALLLKDAIEGILSGDALLLLDGLDQTLLISAKGWEKRGVTEPDTETVVRGPREGFTENMRTNTALIRRRIQNPSLRCETVRVGDRTRTPVAIMYIEGLINPAIIKEIHHRLESIRTDAILASGYLEEFIEDEPLSVFPTMGYSEKPDVIAARILEGRAALVVDGTSFVLSLPHLFIENFQTAEDYAVRFYYSSFLRLLRLLAFTISLLGPALYVAMTTFHQELIPTPLLFTIAASSEDVPFPAAIESSMMLIVFEILKEAGVRLPRPVGQAISIVGALVMGQAAVEAGFVGAPVVIVIAFTAVAGFVSPFVAEASTLLRWYLLILAAAMGGFGITLGMLTILVHLASLKSFSTPYLSPFAPLSTSGLKDAFIRAPLWVMRTRPRALKPQDIQRQDMDMPKFSDDGSEDSIP